MLHSNILREIQLPTNHEYTIHSMMVMSSIHRTGVNIICDPGVNICDPASSQTILNATIHMKSDSGISWLKRLELTLGERAEAKRRVMSSLVDICEEKMVTTCEVTGL